MHSRFARLAATAVLALAAAAACTTESPSAARSFCSETEARLRACSDPSPCDRALAGACGSLDAVLAPSTVSSAQGCLESGICSTSYCVARAQGSAKPSDAHRALAERFCSACAPEIEGCEDLFYAKQGRLPGGLVLPYGEAVASAVTDACTADAKTCRTGFASCAIETVTRVLGEQVGAETAACITRGLERGDDEASAPDGGPRVLSCTPESCNGCCRDDRCLEGTTAAACGGAGAGCQQCGTGQQCKGARCVEPCGPNTCKGCCDGDVCVIGTETARCGGAGEACASCTTQGASFTCSNQRCIDGACKATCSSGCCGPAGCQPGTAASACGKSGEACVACGYGRTCGGGKSCEVDPSSRWSLVVLSAVIPEKNPAGDSWDAFGGPPDPYVELTVEGATVTSGSTSTKADTLSPSWVETPLQPILASDLSMKVGFVIWDADVHYNDVIGGCSIAITPDVFDGQVRQVTCPGSATTVTVTLNYKLTPP